jgi:catechol 2,3-dioxygenase-like lactoylglutathione lyase family enzyme
MQRQQIPGWLRVSLVATGWIFLFAASAGPLFAQIAPPNESGVSIGHMQLIVRNPEVDKKLWVDILGAKVTRSGSLELLKLPGIFIVLEKGEPTGPSAGSSVNHLGLSIKDYADIKAKVNAANIEIAADNYKAAECAAGPGSQACQFTVVFPDGVRVEFTEDKTLKVTAAHHHIHMQTTDRESLRAWYAKVLGAIPGMRRETIFAAKFNDGELDFNAAPMPQLPTRGRAIDHIGFEVKGLAALVKKLEASGVTFETPYRVVPETGLKSAFIIDPVGTRIQLTEGLAAH